MSKKSLILLFAYILIVAQLPMSAPYPQLALLTGLGIAAIVLRDLFINIQKNNIKHPYVFGLTVTGGIGAFSVYVVISKSSSLETMIGNCMVSILFIIVSIFIGIAIGRSLKLKAQKQNARNLQAK